MQSNALSPTAAQSELAVNDLGPLAWVLDELRKSLDGAAKALKRFVRDAEAARGSDLAAIDASQLRLARQQLHQAVGALEMVGLAGPALVLRSMETAVQRFIQQPGQCTQDAAAKIERASFALTDYLEGVLANKPLSAVALFPQYRDVQNLVKVDRVHPADLWAHEWRWTEPQYASAALPQVYGDAARAVFDQSVLQIMKGEAGTSAALLKELSLAFAAGNVDRQAHIFWLLAAAYFEALENGRIPADVYVRRAASRILLQYLSLSKGNQSISERLAQDLLFFCAQAQPAKANSPVLVAVGNAYGLDRFPPVDYEAVQFGRFDPALLMQARKRIASAKETWSSISAGDANKFKLVADQFTLVADSLVKLHPPSEPLAQALTQVVNATAQSAKVPAIELAMEMATSVLYLEAAFEDLDPQDAQLADRTRRLADRLQSVLSGGQPQPLEAWMEELYRRVSDKQTMGSVVGELRVALGELEKSLDQFFRDPQDKTILRNVPGQLSQMRGVLSVLGLDQASQAVLRMRDSVEEMLVIEIDEQMARAAGTFDALGNNLGALSFLVDMLNYQPALAKKLFIYDAEKGELKPLMGRVSKSTEAADNTPAHDEPLLNQVAAVMAESQADATEGGLKTKLDALATNAALAEQPLLAKTASDAANAVVQGDAVATATALTGLASTASQISFATVLPAPLPEQENFEEDDLRDIFLEEAREVVANGQEALKILIFNPADIGQLTTLRRVFHTLKGSSRMVGLNEFGEAGWAMEQLLNSWLADQKPASDDLRAVTTQALAGFSAWVNDIAEKQDHHWQASAFRMAADTLRTEGRVLALDLPVKGAASDRLDSALESAEAPDVLPTAASMDLPELAGTEVIAIACEDMPPEIEALFGLDVPAVEPKPTQAIPALGHHAPASDNALTFAAAAEPDLSVERRSDFSNADAENALPAFDLVEAFDVSLDPETGTPHELAELTDADIESAFLELAAAPDGEQAVAVASDAANDVAVPSIVLDLTAETAASAALQDDTPDALQVEPKATEAALQSVHDTENAYSPVQNAGAIQPMAESALVDSGGDDQVKVIGELRIGIPLYNVYLNEADEWSRRLVTDLSEWAVKRDQAVDDSTLAYAHSLAGSSATVGFEALSEIARALEHALQHSQNYHPSSVTAEHAALFVGAAEDIRRLLHQFAAGFLKTPDAQLLQRLKEMEFIELSASQFGDDAQDSLLPSPVDFADAIDLSATDVIAVSDRLSEPPDAPDATALTPLMPLTSLTPVAAPVIPAADNIARFISPGAAAFVPEPIVLSTDSSHDGNSDDDDIDAVDAIDAELFPIFEEEAAELIPQLGAAMRQWSARPAHQSSRMEVLRALHTLKGSARLAGALRLGEMAHRIESEIEFLGSEPASGQDFEPLMGRFDRLEATFEALRAADAAGFEAQYTAPTPETATSTAVSPGAAPAAEMPSAVEIASITAADLQSANAAQAESDAALVGSKMIPAPQAMSMQPLRQAATASIRVRSQLLDRMVNQAGEVMITRSRLEVELNQLRVSLGDMNGNLNRLRQQLRDIELQAETQMQSRLAQAKELQAGFDPLEFDRFTRVQELTRMMAESVNDVATVQRTLQRTLEATEDDLVAQARQTRELQRDLLRTRMVEFEGISDRLYRVVRQASKETGKLVKLDLLGGTIEMDRGMLDRMTPAFEHLLRNCVAHGIESPEARALAGKDPAGLITVHLRQEGNDVSVDFSDDGAGLDLKRIREKAAAQGLVSPDQVLDDTEAANLIFLPGFTTAAQVTELAGRGIGMDVVRSEVNGVGGRIETRTVAGQGTHFKLVLPLTTAVTQVVMVRSGELSVGVPANVVETVRRTSTKDLQQAYNSGFIELGGESIPFFWSGALLQASHHSSEVQGKTTPVVVFRSAAQRIAVHVDEVLGNREVVVKNLGPQLSRLPGLAGMSVLASGAVVLIYNPVALASVYGDQARAWSQDSAEPHGLEAATGGGARLSTPVPHIPLIMVVDDSITVRRVTQRLLQREGYRVVMAADGLQALERLQEERPAVVLSDIEMPRMDGFDLARNIRADAKLRGLPIVMITSRIAEKHREHAKELGVDHYLGKPYAEDELMSLVRHYCNVELQVA